ncbi:hypothetical protein KKG41_01425 [Patescibacteria group bacterium]|nr:hypothetical protein [Patescibacteria group bacterium]MBU1890577.1 hypothetical protein [Patescibacteria group bacterium]
MEKLIKLVPYYKVITRLGAIVLLLTLAFAPLGVMATDITDYSTNLGVSEENLDTQITNIIQWALGFLALVAVVMIIYGGFTWLTAAGNEERVEQAKKVISAAIIGLIIILLAWAIVWFVAQGVNDAAGGSGDG